MTACAHIRDTLMQDEFRAFHGVALILSDGLRSRPARRTTTSRRTQARNVPEAL